MSPSPRLGRNRTARGALFAILLCLSACGGGGGGDGGSTMVTGWTKGVFQPSSHFAALCQNPRSGNDPFSGDPYPDAQGTTLDENNWLRSWSNELYLWYSEIPDVDPASLSTTAIVLRRAEDPAHHLDRDSQGPLSLHLRHLGLGGPVAVRERRRLRRRL